MNEGAALDVLMAHFNALRAEIIQRLSIQSAMLGAKVTFISAAFMYVFSNAGSELTGAMALCLPAAALLFDYLYIGQDLAIRGLREHMADELEPEMARLTGLRPQCLWETCARARGERRASSYGTTARRLGNEGLSAFVMLLAIWVAWDQLMRAPWLWAVVALYLLVFADNMYVQWWLLRPTGRARCGQDD